MHFRAPILPEILSADGGRLYPLLNSGTDFTIIIVALSYLDACLTSLLARRFKKSSVTADLLDANKGPLGSLTSKAMLAYLLGLIDKKIFQKRAADHGTTSKFGSSYTPRIGLHVRRVAKAVRQLEVRRSLSRREYGALHLRRRAVSDHTKQVCFHSDHTLEQDSSYRIGNIACGVVSGFKPSE